MVTATEISDSIPYPSGSCYQYIPISCGSQSCSADGVNWGSPVAVGTYLDTANLQTTTFTPANAQYVKITALSEAGGRGPYTSIAEVHVFTGAALPPAAATAGSWGLTIDFPLVPVSAAIEWSSGRLLVWSAYAPDQFGGSTGLQTVTAVYDPATNLVTGRTVTNIGHDMFCEGLSMDADGGIVAAGGNSDYGTSIYDSPSDSWSDGGVSWLLPPLIPLISQFREFPSNVRL